jgi:hypothetical protein
LVSFYFAVKFTVIALGSNASTETILFLEEDIIVDCGFAVIVN